VFFIGENIDQWNDHGGFGECLIGLFDLSLLVGQ
jgi:hypothetical protein